MHIKEIRIENIRSFRGRKHTTILDLTRPDGKLAGWTVLAGRNGSGKTTFLKTIALAIAGFPTAASLLESFSNWIHQGAHFGSIDILIEPSKKYDHLTARKTYPSSIKAGLAWGKTNGPEPVMHVSGSVRTPVRSRLDLESGPWATNPQGWFVAGYGPCRRLGGSTLAFQQLEGSTRFDQLKNLFREDASLLEGIDWLRAIHLRRLERRPGASLLLKNIQKLLNDNLLPEGGRVQKVDSDGLWIRREGLSLPLQELSDGYRITTALIIDLSRQLYACFGEFKLAKNRNGNWFAPYPGIVLIDEIENHLHISWQQRIGFWLKEHFPNIQFIVTTHSPYICQAADPNGLIRLPAPGETLPARHVSGSMFSTIVNGSTDDAALTELFGLDHTYSWRSERIRDQVAKLEAKVINGRATAQDRRELRDFSELLPQTGTTKVETLLAGLAKA
ncbi:AAA family ATPase [Corallococcus exiguus]|uniref:AAA family ATPase n=1 Tax=Corallococcus exiguus TaxID=83462 RepID=UPI003DA482AC